MVKHTDHHTCESALFYNRSTNLITDHCPFSFFHNHSVTPSVLDGGNQLVLANVKVGHSPTCDPQQLNTLSDTTYSLTSREILCNCTLQSDLAYLPSDLGACNSIPTRIYFEEQPNIAFSSTFQDLLVKYTTPAFSESSASPTGTPDFLSSPDFPLNLTLPFIIALT